jgi:hypothetical protein
LKKAVLPVPDHRDQAIVSVKHADAAEGNGKIIGNLAAAERESAAQARGGITPVSKRKWVGSEI